jgi:hypothetical protein
MTDKKPRISVISPHFDGHVEIGRLDCRDGVLWRSNRTQP